MRGMLRDRLRSYCSRLGGRGSKPERGVLAGPPPQLDRLGSGFNCTLGCVYARTLDSE